MFVDYRGGKQALLDYNNLELTKWPQWDFSKGLTHDFSQKLEISSMIVFGKK